MITITSVDEKYFLLDGVKYAKIYQPLKQGSSAIGLYNVFDTSQQLLNSTEYNKISIDGVVYASQIIAISVILGTTFSIITAYQLGLVSEKVNSIELLVNDLVLNQITGVEVYTLYDDLPISGVLLTSYKVSNDTDSSKNGYYHWNGAVYVKDADLVINVIDSENTSDSVSGQAVSKFVIGEGLGAFITGAYSNQEGKMYLTLQATKEKYLNVEIDSNIVDGQVYFLQYREAAGTYTLINSILIENNIADLSDFDFVINDWLGFLILNSTSGGIEFLATGGNTKYIVSLTDIPATITEASLTDSTLSFSFKLKEYSVVDDKIIYNNQFYYDKGYIDALEGNLNKNNFVQKVGNIQFTNFRGSNFPSPWTNNGFTATANGMTSPVTGDYTTKIEYDQYSNLDSFVCLFKFNMVAESDILLANYHKKLTVLGGHIVRFDFINKAITLYEATLEDVEPTVVIKSEVIPFNVLGEVVVRYERNAMQEQYTLINGANTYTMTYDTTKASVSTGGGYDKYALVFIEGEIVVTEAQYSSQLAEKPDILILGDSIVNGDTIRNISGYENELGGLIGTTNPGTQSGNLYLIEQINYETEFDILTIESNKVGGTLYFVQYRQNGANFDFIASKSIVSGPNDISNFIFKVGDWVGFVGLDLTSGGIKFNTIGGAIKYITGQLTIPASIEIALMTEASFVFSFKMTGGLEVIGNETNRWAGIIGKKTLVSIASLGGNTVEDIVRDLDFYLGLFQPRKCIFGVGINDTVLLTYTTNADLFITACETAGVEPILQTLFPRAGREAYCEAVSEWVRAKGVRYLDFRRRVTTNGEGSATNAYLFLTDGLHPNLQGHRKMAMEVENLIEL